MNTRDILFYPGQIVATKSAMASLSNEDMIAALVRHLAGDWGELSEADKYENEQSLKYGQRLMSVYANTQGVKFWIITECDRSVTTILLPDDY